MLTKPKTAALTKPRTVALSLSTAFCALGIGFVMQAFMEPEAPKFAQGDIQFNDITPTSSAAPMPRLRLPKMPAEARAPGQQTGPEGVQTAAASMGDMTNPAGTAQPNCRIDMDATPAPGAMVDLNLSAPCQGGETVVLHHHGMMVSETLSPEGTLQTSLPALNDRAVFVAAFDNGEGAVALTEVAGLNQMDRVVVQWEGDMGLELHAREFGAEYFQPGHVWHDASGDVAAVAEGESGFMLRLGDTSVPNALVAEVYTYPTASTNKQGTVLMTVETEVTAQNCGRDIMAQTIELHHGAKPRVQDVTFALPDCSAMGEFLVLKNTVEDLTIAAN